MTQERRRGCSTPGMLRQFGSPSGVCRLGPTVSAGRDLCLDLALESLQRRPSLLPPPPPVPTPPHTHPSLAYSVKNRLQKAPGPNPRFKGLEAREGR